jgi:hypothetical protein
MTIAYDWARVLEYAFVVLIPLACAVRLSPPRQVAVVASVALLAVISPLVNGLPGKLPLEAAACAAGIVALGIPTIGRNQQAERRLGSFAFSRSSSNQSSEL